MAQRTYLSWPTAHYPSEHLGRALSCASSRPSQKPQRDIGHENVGLLAQSGSSWLRPSTGGSRSRSDLTYESATIAPTHSTPLSPSIRGVVSLCSTAQMGSDQQSCHAADGTPWQISILMVHISSAGTPSPFVFALLACLLAVFGCRRLLSAATLHLVCRRSVIDFPIYSQS